MNKINLIFDIDDTLIKTLLVKDNNQKNENLIKVNNNYGNVLFRPYLKSFLKFCYKYFNVGFWTAGSCLYCKEIIKLILNEQQYFETTMILARDNNDYIDLKTNKFFKNIIKDKIIKPLDILWEDKTYNKIFNLKNTLLIDDNSDILEINKNNYILVNEFENKNDNDSFLCYLSNLLDLIKEYEDIRNIVLLKNISFDCNKINNN